MVLTRLETKLDHATASLADHETRLRTLAEGAVTEEDIAQLRQDVESLKRARWPLPAAGALTGIGGLAIALWQASGH